MCRTRANRPVFVYLGQCDRDLTPHSHFSRVIRSCLRSLLSRLDRNVLGPILTAGRCTYVRSCQPRSKVYIPARTTTGTHEKKKKLLLAPPNEMSQQSPPSVRSSIQYFSFLDRPRAAALSCLPDESILLQEFVNVTRTQPPPLPLS